MTYRLLLRDARLDEFGITWTFDVQAPNYSDVWTINTPRRRPSIMYDAQARSGYASGVVPLEGVSTGDRDLDRQLLERIREELARAELANALRASHPERRPA
jgi:hypothetical protein